MTTETQAEIDSILHEFTRGDIDEQERDEAIQAIATRGRALIRTALDNNAV
jgi:hypothetical protein